MTKAMLVLAFLVYSMYSISNAQTPAGDSSATGQDEAQFARFEEETKATLERSRTTRSEVQKGLPQREIAAINAEDEKRFAEFKKLVEEDSDTPVFNEIDQILAEGKE